MPNEYTEQLLSAVLQNEPLENMSNRNYSFIMVGGLNHVVEYCIGMEYIKAEKEPSPKMCGYGFLNYKDILLAPQGKKFLEDLEEDEKNFSEPITEYLLEHGTYIREDIKEGLQRVHNGDLKGAITLAKSILEKTCKTIADERGITYKKHEGLSCLCKKIFEDLFSSKDNHNKKILNKISGGCSGIISGISELRNNEGDAHGKSAKRENNLSPQDAELSINLAGSLSLFLIKTHEENNQKGE